MNQVVHLEVLDGIATVTIDNPPMNVLSSQVTRELKSIFVSIKENPEVKAVLLTGAGEKAFMAGADIKEFPGWVDLEKEELKKVTSANHEVFNLIDDLPKPTIALLNGFALGGGCELALACDIRIAEEHVKLGLPEIKLGLFPGAGGTQRLPRLVGAAKAKELMYFGDPISAEEAHRIGLVNQVVPRGEGKEVAKGMAKRLSAFSLQSISRIKKAVNEGADKPLHEALELEINLFLDNFNTEDVREGISAFLEKREAQFSNR